MCIEERRGDGRKKNEVRCMLNAVFVLNICNTYMSMRCEVMGRRWWHTNRSQAHLPHTQKLPKNVSSN
jgi:hypothetical protein